MGEVMRWDGMNLYPGVDDFVPGVCGRGDWPFTRQSSFNPGSAFWPNGPKITIQNGPGGSTDPSRYMLFEDYAGGTAHTRLEADFNYARESSHYGNSAALTTWSASWFYYLDEDLVINAPQRVVEFLDGSNITFGINLQEFVAFQDVARKLRFYGPSYGSTYTTYQLPWGGANHMRFELQVNNSGSPKTTCRVYAGNSLTPAVTFTGSPTSAAATTIRFGDNNSGIYNKPMRIGRVRVWDTYDADGQFPGWIWSDPTNRYTWFEWDKTEGELTPLEVVGTWDAATETIVTTDKTFGEFYIRNVVPKGFSKTAYTYGANGQALDAYVPGEIAPPGGRMWLAYAHGGFMISGDKNQFSQDLMHEMINRNIACFSINYILSQVGLFGTPPAWPTAAKYPDHILQYKLAMRWIQNHASTFGINPDKGIAGGFSAGSGLALGANCTIDLSDDGYGRDMRLSGAIGALRGGAGMGTDPVPIGSFTWASLTSMKKAFDYDLSHPNYGVGDLGVGNVRLAAGAYMGTYYATAPNLAGTSTAEHLFYQYAVANNPTPPPIAVTHGTSDYLLDYHQYEDLLIPTSLYGNVPYYVYLAPGIQHDPSDKVYDINDFDIWLETL